jgi:D-sedoheptulose 7-phosphate isomerase
MRIFMLTTEQPAGSVKRGVSSTQRETLAYVSGSAIVDQRFQQSIDIPTQFFEAEADHIARACLAMARRFYQRGRLIAFGNGAAATDAQHVAVEFVHPVIVGKRALPALALTNDSILLSGLQDHTGHDPFPGIPFAHHLAVLARPQDMAMGFSPDGDCANVVTALLYAKVQGLLTLGLTGGDGGVMATADLDYCFVVPSTDRFAVQETHEMLYHILWELVHIFFEHEGLLV